MWNLISTDNQRPTDPPPVIEQESDNVFIYGSGPFVLEPGESQRFSIALLMGVDFDDLLNNAEICQQVFESDYRFAQAPKKPKLVAVPGDQRVTLYWDSGAETSFDPFVARANPDSLQKGFDFEGYRIYRSRDFSFNDTQTITDSKGIPFLSEPLKMANQLPAQFDLINQYQGLSEIEYAGRGIRYDLGRNTGLVHTFIDSNNVQNGITYFYAVTSYDHGDENAQLAPTESQRVIQRSTVTRLFSFDVNTAMVVPGPPAAGFVNPRLEETEGNLAKPEIGNATGDVVVTFVDPLLVKDGKKYDIKFEEVQLDSLTTVTSYSVIDLQEQTTTFVARDTFFVNLISGVQLVEGSVSVSELSGTPIDTSMFIVDPVSARIRGAFPGALPSGQSFSATFIIKPVASSVATDSSDSNPVFDGIKLLIRDDPLGLDSLSTAGGQSGFITPESNTNFSDEFTRIGFASVGDFAPYPSDFEFRFTNYDTTEEGNLRIPADTAVFSMVETNFQIIDVWTGEGVDFFINEVPGLRNKRWDWQESINLLKPNGLQTETTYEVKFSPPVDTFMSSSGMDSSVVRDPIYPGDGDKFLLFSTKPFDAGDKYSFTTKAAQFDNAKAKNVLDDIIVVPDPYIAFSHSEIAFRTGQRDDRRIEFRNLPQKCTIRIYTMVGELVDTIEKNDVNSYAVWNLLSAEAQEIAYGVYIYHVDAPGVGTKIGRFAVIK
jgi:hypothetical protein